MDEADDCDDSHSQCCGGLARQPGAVIPVFASAQKSESNGKNVLL